MAIVVNPVEPDLSVAPHEYTEDDKRQIREAIVQYRKSASVGEAIDEAKRFLLLGKTTPRR